MSIGAEWKNSSERNLMGEVLVEAGSGQNGLTSDGGGGYCGGGGKQVTMVTMVTVELGMMGTGQRLHLSP